MWKEEFEKRVGTTLTDDEFKIVIYVYMNTPESFDVDAAVELWYESGIRGFAFREHEIMVEQLLEKDESIRRLMADKDAFTEDMLRLTDENDTLRGRVQELEDALRLIRLLTDKMA